MCLSCGTTIFVINLSPAIFANGIIEGLSNFWGARVNPGHIGYTNPLIIAQAGCGKRTPGLPHSAGILLDFSVDSFATSESLLVEPYLL